MAPGFLGNAKERVSLPVSTDTRVGYVRDIAPDTAGMEVHPWPTDDYLDPLNWSKAQKWTSLGIVMWMYFLFTYITTVTVLSFPQLKAQYNISDMQVDWTVAIPALGLSIGPLFWSSIADVYGRRIIIIIGTVVALLATIGSAVAPDYAGYMTARFFQGFGVSPAATVGMAVINDLFFEYERGQKLGLWVMAMDMGLLVGPLVGGFISLIDQFWVEWVTAILFGLLLVAELLFFPETLYPRKLMLSRLPTTGADDDITTVDDMPRSRTLPWLNFWKVPGVEHPKPWDAVLQFGRVWTLPNVAVAVFFYCFAWYWWVLSVITYLPTAYAEYTPDMQGLRFLGLILGTLMCELFCSGGLSDAIVVRLAKKNGNVRVPEMRLWLVFPAVVLTSVGLILWGISVDKKSHWIVGQIALFLFAAGIQMGNSAISAYIVDCYPGHAMSVVIFYSVLLNLSAFVNPFFIEPWVESMGFTWTFATQGLVTLIMVPVTMGLMRWGGGWRDRRGEPEWAGSG
ncbi:hypothetical protein Q9L58_002603 [Maublancomyces gigas]|uniref:Major facilitator superfamily (MFS) profile domain-containing protein n=1 Tax=Discina gigas TaxID=1032678 RepID=A0ABR3GQT5_9PEZI